MKRSGSRALVVVIVLPRCVIYRRNLDTNGISRRMRDKEPAFQRGERVVGSGQICRGTTRCPRRNGGAFDYGVRPTSCALRSQAARWNSTSLSTDSVGSSPAPGVEE